MRDTNCTDDHMANAHIASTSSTSEPSSISENRELRNLDIRVNNNGEAVFDDESTFRYYVTGIFEQVVLSMADFQPTILMSKQRESNESSWSVTDSTQGVFKLSYSLFAFSLWICSSYGSPCWWTKFFYSFRYCAYY